MTTRTLLLAAVATLFAVTVNISPSFARPRMLPIEVLSSLVASGLIATACRSSCRTSAALSSSAARPHACRHQALIDGSGYPADTEVPSCGLGLRLVGEG